jgi:hypothetical protein
VTKAAILPFLRSLSNGSFPRLRELELEAGREIDREVMGALSQALLALVNNGTPSRLAKLRLGNWLITMDTQACATFIRTITRVFEAGGLPCLTELKLRSAGGSEGDAGLFDPWNALGSKIKLERLWLMVNTSDALREKLLEYLADPGFCPPLRGFFAREIQSEDSDAALEERRRKREALAAAAAGMGGGRR